MTKTMNKIHVAFAVAFIAVCSVALLPGTTKAGEPGKSETVLLDAQPQELVRHTVWDARDPLKPKFLPASVIGQTKLQGLNIDEETRSSLEAFFEFQQDRQAAGQPMICHKTSEESMVENESPEGRKLVDLLADQDLVALGKVRAVVPGWGVHQPLSMIYVETEELLHCRHGYGDGYPVRDVTVGEIVSTTLDAGSFQVRGTTLCSWTPKSFILPVVGDQVIITGRPRPEDPYFMEHWGLVFPVENGLVRPQPYANLQWDTVPLGRIRAALNGPNSLCRVAP